MSASPRASSACSVVLILAVSITTLGHRFTAPACHLCFCEPNTLCSSAGCTHCRAPGAALHACRLLSSPRKRRSSGPGRPPLLPPHLAMVRRRSVAAWFQGRAVRQIVCTALQAAQIIAKYEVLSLLCASVLLQLVLQGCCNPWSTDPSASGALTAQPPGMPGELS